MGEIQIKSRKISRWRKPTKKKAGIKKTKKEEGDDYMPSPYRLENKPPLLPHLLHQF
jgi:hypothetical protein